MVGLLNHKDQKQTYRSIRQISKETRLIKSGIIQIIHCISGWKRIFLPTRLLSMIASFSCIYISQGILSTQLTRGRIFNNHFIANCPRNVSVKKFWKSVDIWRRYRQSQSGTFWGHSVFSNLSALGLQPQSFRPYVGPTKVMQPNWLGWFATCRVCGLNSSPTQL